MQARTHLAGGVIAGLAVASYTDFHPVLTTGAAVVGSLLPDIDHAKSKISNSNPIMSLLSAVVNLFFTHRTFTHSLVFTFLVGYLFYWLDLVPELLPGIVAGILSHLFLDAITKQGIKLFWPLPITFRIPLYIRTGSNVEKLIELLLWGIVIYFAATELGLIKGS